MVQGSWGQMGGGFIVPVRLRIASSNPKPYREDLDPLTTSPS